MGWGSTDSFVTDAELKDMIAESMHELHDLLISVHQGEFEVGTVTVATVADTEQYDLGSGNKGTLIYKLLRVSVDFDNVSIPMRRMDIETSIMDSSSYSWSQGSDLRYRFTHGGVSSGVGPYINFHPTPDAAHVVKIMYNRTPLTLSLSTDTNTTGHDEYLTLDCCIKLAQMEESDPSGWMAQKSAYRERLENLAPPMDPGNPATIQDVRGVDKWRSDWQSFRRWWI